MILIAQYTKSVCRNCSDDIFIKDEEWFHTDGHRACYTPVTFAAPDEAVGR